MRIDIRATPEQLNHILDSMEGYCDGCPSRTLCRIMDAAARAAGRETSAWSCRRIIAASFNVRTRWPGWLNAADELRIACRLKRRAREARKQAREARRCSEQRAEAAPNPAKGVKAPALPTKTINEWAGKKERANGGN